MRTLQQLADMFRSNIEREGLTQEQLASSAGVSRQTLSKILSGRADFKLTTLFAIADRLGLEVVLVPKEIAPSMEATDDARPRVLSVVDAALNRLK